MTLLNTASTLVNQVIETVKDDPRYAVGLVFMGIAYLTGDTQPVASVCTGLFGSGMLVYAGWDNLAHLQVQNDRPERRNSPRNGT